MIQLVERDFRIIDFLKHEGWVLSTQLSNRFFEGSRHTCSNRMRLLTKASIVETLNLSQFRERFWHERGLLNLFCDLSGRTKVYRLSQNIRDSLGRRWQRASSDFMLAHQVLLGSIRERIETEFPHAIITAEASESLRIEVSNANTAAVPDLIAQMGNMRVAVELERKARRGLSTFNFAYEDRFQALSLEYDAVLYVVENEDHLGPLTKRADGMRRVGFSSILNLNEVFRCDREITSLASFIDEAKQYASLK